MEFSKEIRQAKYTLVMNEVEAASLKWLLQHVTKAAKVSGMYPLALTIIEKLPGGRR